MRPHTVSRGKRQRIPHFRVRRPLWGGGAGSPMRYRFRAAPGKGCQGEPAPAVNTGSVPLEVIVEGWAAICKAHLQGCAQKVCHVVAAYEPRRVPDAAGVDVVRDQKQPGVFEPTRCQHVETCMDEESAPRLRRGPDVVDRSSGGFYLDVQSVPAHEDPQKRGFPELGRVTLREIRGRAPALKT